MKESEGECERRRVRGAVIRGNPLSLFLAHSHFPPQNLPTFYKVTPPKGRIIIIGVKSRFSLAFPPQWISYSITSRGNKLWRPGSLCLYKTKSTEKKRVCARARWKPNEPLPPELTLILDLSFV